MSYTLTLVIEVNGNLLQVTVMKETRTKTVYDSNLGATILGNQSQRRNNRVHT